MKNQTYSMENKRTVVFPDLVTTHPEDRYTEQCFAFET